MHLIRDVLDNQLVDRNQRKMGKVDGIVIELRPGQPPRLAYLETGATALARRLHPRLYQWIFALERRWGKCELPYRISWAKVRDTGIDVEIDVEAEQTPALDYERWLRNHVIKHIPGGK